VESRLHGFIFRFTFLFTSLTRSVSSTAYLYLKGMLLCRRRNCQLMAEELGEGNQQRLHHFITASKWQFEKVMDMVTVLFWQLLQKAGLGKDTYLIIDETAIPKKENNRLGSNASIAGSWVKPRQLPGGSLWGFVWGSFGEFGAGPFVFSQERSE
jgi:SRSO17 transposase